MYKLVEIKTSWDSVQCVVRITDNASIPFDPANTDYQEYLEWLADGGVPEDADA